MGDGDNKLAERLSKKIYDYEIWKRTMGPVLDLASAAAGANAERQRLKIEHDFELLNARSEGARQGRSDERSRIRELALGLAFSIQYDAVPGEEPKAEPPEKTLRDFAALLGDS